MPKFTAQDNPTNVVLAQKELVYMWAWVTILLMAISLIFGSAAIIKHNLEPLD